LKQTDMSEPDESVLRVAHRILDSPLENGGNGSELFMWAVETLERLEGARAEAA
jgi:hypothetical protein